jgi:hypothetical protein
MEKTVPILDKSSPDLRLHDIAHTDWVEVQKGDKTYYIHYLGNSILAPYYLLDLYTITIHPPSFGRQKNPWNATEGVHRLDEERNGQVPYRNSMATKSKGGPWA